MSYDTENGISLEGRRREAITQKDKDDMVLLSYTKGVTLNSKPAAIGGRLNRFATVAEFGGPLSVEVSWPCVIRVMAKNRAFNAA